MNYEKELKNAYDIIDKLHENYMLNKLTNKEKKTLKDIVIETNKKVNKI